MIIWKCPFFSFWKNKSGFQIFSGSVNTKYWMRPLRLSNCSRLSFQFCRNVIWHAYSCNYNNNKKFKKHKSNFLNVDTILSIRIKSGEALKLNRDHDVWWSFNLSYSNAFMTIIWHWTLTATTNALQTSCKCFISIKWMDWFDFQLSSILSKGTK